MASGAPNRRIRKVGVFGIGFFIINQQMTE